jgi:hypothetical protein
MPRIDLQIHMLRKGSPFRSSHNTLACWYDILQPWLYNMYTFMGMGSHDFMVIYVSSVQANVSFCLSRSGLSPAHDPPVSIGLPALAHLRTHGVTAHDTSLHREFFRTFIAGTMRSSGHVKAHIPCVQSKVLCSWP